MKLPNTNVLIAISVIVALFTGYLDQPIINGVASTISDIFISLLKLVSVPIIFLSIISTVAGMENIQEFKTLGKRVLKYTLLTTYIAALLAFFIFLTVQPVGNQTLSQVPETIQNVAGNSHGYLTYLIKAIPSNIVQPFSENHVIAVLFLAILFSLAILALPNHNRKVLHELFSSLYAMIMKITSWIVLWIPLGIWSFIVLFIKDVRGGLDLKSLGLYLSCVVAANLIQGFVTLPIFIKMKGISPIKLFRGMLPALSVAFFTKSSSATLPSAMRCAEENLGISKKMTSFTLPLCTAINMNGCAAFIFTTVLFVSMSNGISYSIPEMFIWTFVATIAAVGNAGVPMGCFFLSSAFLAAMNVPLNILGIILPFYTMIDMLETAINVWSDSCVVAVVDREVRNEQPIAEPVVA